MPAPALHEHSAPAPRSTTASPLLGPRWSCAGSSRMRRMAWPMAVPPGSTVSMISAPSSRKCARRGAASASSSRCRPIPSKVTKCPRRDKRAVRPVTAAATSVVDMVQHLFEVFPRFAFGVLRVGAEQERWVIGRHNLDAAPVLPVSPQSGDAFLGCLIALSPPCLPGRRSLSDELSATGGTGTGRRSPSRQAMASGFPEAGISRHCRCKRLPGEWLSPFFGGGAIDHLGEQLSGSPDERQSRRILVRARALTDERPAWPAGLPEPKTILLRFSHRRQRRQSPISSLIFCRVSSGGATGMSVGM